MNKTVGNTQSVLSKNMIESVWNFRYVRCMHKETQRFGWINYLQKK